jgi:hypothetical protein
VHHQYQQHRRQILPAVPLVLLILVVIGINDNGSKFATFAVDTDRK